jgi:hypothetical protein
MHLRSTIIGDVSLFSRNDAGIYACSFLHLTFSYKYNSHSDPFFSLHVVQQTLFLNPLAFN